MDGFDECRRGAPKKGDTGETEKKETEADAADTAAGIDLRGSSSAGGSGGKADKRNTPAEAGGAEDQPDL